MSKFMLADEFHVSLYAPSELGRRAFATLRRLMTTRLGAELRRAAHQLVHAHPALVKVRIKVSR